MFTNPDHRPTQSRRTIRTGPLIAGLLLSVAPVLTLGGPAAATDEFPADPHAEITFGCGTSGAKAEIAMTNPAGLSSAHFTLSYADQEQLFSVAPGEAEYGGFGSFTENDSHTVTATASNGYTVSATLDNADCYDTVGTIVLVCEGDQPVLHAEATMLGVGTVVDFEHDGVVDSHGFTGSHAFTAPVVEDQPFTAEMRTSEDGVFATLEGTPDCVPAIPITIPDPEIPITIPEVPEVPDVPEVPVDMPEVPVDVPEVPVDRPEIPVVPEVPKALDATAVPVAAAPDAPAPTPAPATAAATALPRTGADSTQLASIGATLLGLGILVRRWSVSLSGR